MKFHFLLGLALLAGAVCRADLSREVLDEINRARENPGTYAEVIARQDAPGSSPETKAAILESLRFLEKTRPLPPLTLCPPLVLSAQSHVDDTGPAGITGHTGTDRSNPARRMARYGKITGYGGENISYGCNTARAIVTSLIIDKGVSNRGHRKNIFNPNFKMAGVATGRHSRYGIMCVTDFASGFIPLGGEDKTPLFR